jgi:prolyl-tRNA synthetase
VVTSRRDKPGKDGKNTLAVAGLASEIQTLLSDIQSSMLASAKAFRAEHLHEAATYDDLKRIVEDGWALIYHCGTRECEDKIKEETKATSRCYPLELNEQWSPPGKKCAVCGKPAFGKAYFARAY